MLLHHDVVSFIESNKLGDSIICLHASMKSFGETELGPHTIIQAFIQKGSTIVVPAFYYQSETNPKKENYIQNGIDYKVRNFNSPINYIGSIHQIEKSMGIIPKTILSYQGVIRSKHPMGSFAGVGPYAKDIISTQSLLNVYSSYKKIYDEYSKSFIIMAGTDLTSCTPIHFAEEKSGRTLFRRWALMDNEICEFEVGGCSSGFNNLLPYLKTIQQEAFLGSSKILIYPFKAFIDIVVKVIQEQPSITHCNNEECICCRDIILGGPKLNTI